MPLVGVVIGSKTDEPLVQDTLGILDSLGIDHELLAISAHRTPQKVADYASSAENRGIEVIIAGAGGAAALPGTVAAWTRWPCRAPRSSRVEPQNRVGRGDGPVRADAGGTHR